MSMEGEVMSDCFEVQIRGVATALPRQNTHNETQHASSSSPLLLSNNKNCDVQIDFGVFCVFTKQTLIARKVRQITTEETQKSMDSLFGKMSRSCGCDDSRETLSGSIFSPQQLSLSEQGSSTISGPSSDAENKKSVLLGVGLVILVFILYLVWSGGGTRLYHEYGATGSIMGGVMVVLLIHLVTHHASFDWIRKQIIQAATATSAKDDIDETLSEIHAIYDQIKRIPNTIHEKVRSANVEVFQKEFEVACVALRDILVRDKLNGLEREGKLPQEGEALLMAHTPTKTPWRSLAKTTTKIGKNTKRLFQPTTWTSSISKLPSNTKKLLRGPKKKDDDNQLVEDHTLGDMVVGIKDTIENCSLEEFYQVICSDSNLKTWQTNTGKENVSLDSWEVSVKDGSNKIVDPWNGEYYDRRRAISYSHGEKDPSAMYAIMSDNDRDSSNKDRLIGRVKQTIYAKKNGDRKIVVSFAGVGTAGLGWMGHYCNIHVRWVITTVSPGTLSIKVGLFVVMKKFHMLAVKLNADAYRIGIQNQTSFLQQVKKTLGSRLLASRSLSMEAATNTAPIHYWWPACLLKSDKSYYEGTMLSSDDNMMQSTRKLTRRLQMVNEVLGHRYDDDFVSKEDVNYFLSQLAIVREALKHMVDFHRTCRDGHASKPTKELNKSVYAAQMRGFDDMMSTARASLTAS